MASVVITSFFTRGGSPATNIETLTPGYPKARIWEVVDGTPTGDSFIGEFVMIPMEDGSNDDGFYKYEFDGLAGYLTTKTYTIRTDGGTSLPPGERFQVARIDPAADLGIAVQDIVDGVWDEPRAAHILPGSTGEALSQIKADTTAMSNALYLDSDSVLEVVQLLLKMEAGRTRIDPTNQTLTVFDEDCTTPLRVFRLLDHTGTPSSTEICERRPIGKGAGDTTTITDVCT